MPSSVNQSLIQVVDENDVPVGEATFKDVLSKGLFHRIARVIVQESSGRVLLQKRSSSVDIFPGYWDNSAAGHVDSGETYNEAASRELEEELGIKAALNEPIGYYKTNTEVYGIKMNRFNTVFRVVVPDDIEIDINPNEVEQVKWFTPNEIEDLIKASPNLVTDGIKDLLKYI